jgi:hypothetical protein
VFKQGRVLAEPRRLPRKPNENLPRAKGDENRNEENRREEITLRQKGTRTMEHLPEIDLYLATERKETEEMQNLADLLFPIMEGHPEMTMGEALAIFHARGGREQ